MTDLTSDRRTTLSDPMPLTRTTNRVQRASNARWHWLYATEAGVAVQGPPVRFATEDTAKQWLDHHAVDLVELRITWVSLLDGERVVDTGGVQEFAEHAPERDPHLSGQ